MNGDHHNERDCALAAEVMLSERYRLLRTEAAIREASREDVIGMVDFLTSVAGRSMMDGGKYALIRHMLDSLALDISDRRHLRRGSDE